MARRPPNVLCLSGHDPSGGAGMQADIEAVAAQGAHAAGVLTALTRQDTRNAYAVTPIAADEFSAEIDTLLADMSFDAFKVGLVATPDQVAVITELAGAHPDTPLVVDPVLRAGGGATLADDPVAEALSRRLFDRATLLTPNAAEARLLCPDAADLNTCGRRLAQTAGWVLVTGGDEPGERVCNTLFNVRGVVERFEWPRLPYHYHGSGCTLAAALAARLALGEDVPAAVAAAQDYTWHCLERSFAPGRGQHVPDRFDRGRR